MDDQEKISWRAYEYEYKEKSADWFWSAGIISVSLSAIAFIYGNILFGLFIILAGITVLLLSHKVPKRVRFELSAKGLSIDDVLYPYQNLRSFWVEESKRTTPKLLVKATKFMMPIIIIPIETNDVDANSVRNFLLGYLPEAHMHEPLSHKIIEIIGF